MIDTKWRCYVAGNCGYGSCMINSVHSDWQKDKNESGVITLYGCEQGNDCSFCSYFGQCKWYKAKLRPQGNLYTVLKKIKSDWSVSLTYISHDGTIDKMSFSSSMVMMKSTGGTKVTIMAPTKSQFHSNDFLLESPEGSIWNVHANNLGDLSSSMIGDLQIGLFNSQEIAFQTNDIRCVSRDCWVNCMAAESGLVRGLRQYFNYTVSADRLGYDRVVRRQEYMTFGLFVTTTSETSLVSIPASCSFEKIMSYGCLACNKQTFVTLQTTNIKSMGLVDITSNCSLDRTRLACQESPQLIVVDNHDKVCQITILKSNQTMIIDIDYIFEGTVYGVVGFNVFCSLNHNFVNITI